MSDQKSHPFRPPLFSQEGDAARPQRSGAGGNEQHGWDAYRKWLTRVGTKAPAGERTPLDHSVYSWRGYHTWADKVRQSWKSET
jgi:hypothetical protein